MNNYSKPIMNNLLSKEQRNIMTTHVNHIENRNFKLRTNVGDRLKQ